MMLLYVKNYIYTYWWWTSVIREYSFDFAIQCHISNSIIIVTIDPWALRIMKKKKEQTNKQNKNKNKKIGSISFRCWEKFYISGNKFQ